jgi:hypothetical protein
MVSGLLPLQKSGAGNTVIAVRGEVDVTKAGMIGLKINSTRGLTLWVGEKKVSLSEPIQIDLPAGRSVLTFVVDTRKRNNLGLKVELVNIPGSTASYKVIGGL